MTSQAMAPVQVHVESGIATLTIARPEALNALNSAVLGGLRQAVDSVRTQAHALIVTGAGKAFVAGADIAEMASLSPPQAQAFSERGQAAFAALADFPGLVVAAVNGYAFGGGLELALACDVILASDKAVVGQPEVGLGVIAGFGGTQRLSRRIGPAKAKWLLMTGDRLKAEEAKAIGLVDWVVPGEELLAKARELAAKAVAAGPLAVASSKRLVDAGLEVALPEALGLEAKAFGACFATADQKEGMAAFLEKRKPAFTGR